MRTATRKAETVTVRVSMAQLLQVLSLPTRYHATAADMLRRGESRGVARMVAAEMLGGGL